MRVAVEKCGGDRPFWNAGPSFASLPRPEFPDQIDLKGQDGTLDVRGSILHGGGRPLRGVHR